MQISNAASSPTLTQTAVNANAESNPAAGVSPNSAAAPTTSVTSTVSSPDQDSAVTISPEGAAVAAQDASSPASDSTSSTSSTSSASDDSGTATSVSPLKSLAYGTLGLERPDQPQENRNPFYTAGRWIAAGLTIGGIVSLLV
jgi:hypothetical protein